uniref:Uncharacterized protein n=1 Tax=Romanomermis culicivorax TaxID=13658 RepID=A0A915HGZ5_ROMCU
MEIDKITLGIAFKIGSFSHGNFKSDFLAKLQEKTAFEGISAKIDSTNKFFGASRRVNVYKITYSYWFKSEGILLE